MEKKNAIKALNKIKDIIKTASYDGDLENYRRDILIIVMDIFGDKNNHYKTVYNSAYISFDVRKEVLSNEIDSMVSELEKEISQKSSLNEEQIIVKSNTNIISFLTIESTPDDFYKNLINEINLLYFNKRYIPVCLLLRKLFENLIIDILRKKYSTAQLELFYNTRKGMFHSFSTLLDNLKNNIDDFKPLDPSFNERIIKQIDIYRERGNSTAHSISVDISQEELEKEKNVINHLIKFLIRILYIIK